MIGWIILALVIIFAAVILVRTLRFTPKAQDIPAAEPVKLDKDAVLHSFRELIRCKTVSYYDHSLEDDAEFEKLVAKLPELFPEVAKTCTMLRFDGRALLFRWAGKQPGPAAVFMAHYDVVPVEEENWSVPAFEAVVKDGAVWGRGTLDTKQTFHGILFAANKLITEGFTPENDIYFAFSGGEEVSGPGAGEIVKYFQENNVELSMVLDEGGAVVEGIFPGVTKQCGLVGIAEKGLANVSFSMNSNGGHASSPAPHTPVGILSAACVQVENHPFRFCITEPVRQMFDTLGRESSFAYRMIFANLWCFAPVLDALTRKSGGELNALVRTTVAFTQMKGSLAPNVIPPSASMVANLRLNPCDSLADVSRHLSESVKDGNVTITVDGEEPSPISRTDVPGWTRVRNAVAQTWDGCIVSPYLMVQCSDSRHYGEISDKVYRFSAADMTRDEMHTLHGNNEHIRLETLYRSVEFFVRVMKQC